MESNRRAIGKSMQQSLWMFSLITLILLAPSSGLITLTVPDEPYTGIAAIPDISHIGKRAPDEFSPISLGILASTYAIYHQLLSAPLLLLNQLIEPHIASDRFTHIRAPPVIVRG